MKVLLISQYFYPENFRINDWARDLKNSGAEVTVLTGYPSYPSRNSFKAQHSADEQWQGCRIVRVPLFSRGQGKSWNLIFNYISFAISASVRLLKNDLGSFDRVVVYEPSPLTVMLPALVFKMRSSAPVTLWIQDLWPDTIYALFPKARFLERILNPVCRLIHQAADEILIQSEAYRPVLIEQKIKSEIVHFYPNWAEDGYDQSEKQRPIDLPIGDNIVYAGNLGEAQQLESLIRLAKHFEAKRSLNFVFIGDGRAALNLKKLVLDLELKNVIFLGMKPPDEVPAYLANSKIAYLGLSDDPIFQKTIPSKLQAYLACGCVILGSISGEAQKIVNESGAGKALNPKDFDGLVKAATELLSMSKDQYETTRNNARSFYLREFDRARLFDRCQRRWMKALELGRVSCAS